MFEFLQKLGDWLRKVLPPLRRTRPQLAAAIGFFFGGVGLAIYFRSFVDFIVPMAVAIVAGLVVVKLFGAGAELGWLAGAIIASLYGLWRSQDSNKRLKDQERPPAVPAGVNPS